MFKRILQNLFLLVLITTSLNSLAARKSKVKAPGRQSQAQAQKPVQRIQTMLIVDSETGRIIDEANSSERIYPASLTKLMTLYLAFQELKSGKLHMDERLPISKHAQNVAPSKLGLTAGQTIVAREAIDGAIVKSANDATIVLAERIAGSESSFARKMNLAARRLGMKGSFFVNSNGLHHPSQKSTAIDLAKLAIAIKRDFPEYYPLFNRDSFSYAGKEIRGHNKVTRVYEGAEGMKTGFTNPAGFNLVTTASKKGKSLVAVLTGYPSSQARDSKMISLLDAHFGTSHKEESKVNPSKSVKSNMRVLAKAPGKESNKRVQGQVQGQGQGGQVQGQGQGGQVQGQGQKDSIKEPGNNDTDSVFAAKDNSTNKDLIKLVSNSNNKKLAYASKSSGKKHKKKVKKSAHRASSRKSIRV